MDDEEPIEGIVEDDESVEEVDPDDIEETTEQELDEDAEEDSEEQAESVDDGDTVEYEGQQYKVPKELKDAFLRQSDYTTKTQEVAEQRKALETDRESFQEALQLQTAHTESYTQLGVIDQQLAQYNEIDWTTWSQTDPNAAQQAQIQLGALREQRQQAVDKLQSLQAQTQQKARTETARVVEQNRAKVEKVVPNWSDETEKAVFNFGIKSGLSQSQLANTNYDPVLIEILNKARLFDEIQTKQSGKKPKKAEPVPQATRVKPRKVAPRGLSDSLSADEWVKRRNAQIAKRG
tara:strand:- start:10443 stop:11318 length:876 start_codon:yes stop_codon:yes gene_type:complete